MALRGGRSTRRGAGALAAATAAHGAILACLAAASGHGLPLAEAVIADPAAAESEQVVAAASVILVDEAELGELVPAVIGAADSTGVGREHPHPRSRFDSAGRTALTAGMGTAGAQAWADRQDSDTRSAQIWNDPQETSTPRVATSNRQRSREAMARDPDRGFGHYRSRRGRLRSGSEDARPGRDEGTGTAEGERTASVRRDWLDADPIFDGAAAQRRQQTIGATQERARRPLVERGRIATDRRRDGRAADDVDAAGRSAERDPAPYERTRASAGGDDGSGAGARRGRGLAAAGTAGSGSAAVRADLLRGGSGGAIRARRQNPYFRGMYRRIDDLVTFPRELAIALEQGEVIVSFTLTASGGIRDLQVDKSSGFDGFDREAVRAFAAAGPFGRPPSAIIGESGQVRIRAPYQFRNPLIR